VVSKKNPDAKPVFRKPKVKSLGLRVPTLPSPHAAFIPQGNSDQTVVEPTTVVESATVVGAHRQTVAPATVDESTTVTSQAVADPPTVGHSTTVEPATVVDRTTVSAPTYSIVVPPKSGERRMPNYVWWGLKPHLSEQEWYVYDELWGWTWGFGRENVRLSRKWLCSNRLGKMTIKQLNRLLTSLSGKGLIVVGDTRNDGPVSTRGTLLTVRLPAIEGLGTETVVESTTVGRSATVGERPTVAHRATVPGSTTHDREEKIKKEDRFDFERLKLIAVRIADSANQKGIRLSSSDLNSKIRETMASVGGDYRDEDVDAVADRFGREGE